MTTPRHSNKLPLLPALVATVVFLPSIGGDFLYDDVPTIVLNRHIRDLGALGTVLRYEPARPLLGLTWALNYAVAGTTPWPYHLVSVIVHAVNAALAASLLLWLAPRARPALPPAAAVFGACLFAASPMAAETVAYVSSRSTALATLFTLAAVRCALPALEAGRTTRGWWAALALFVLGLATKEEAASLPLLLVLADAFFLAPAGSPVTRRARLHAPFWLLPLAGLAARRMATGVWLPEGPISRPLYLLTQWAAFPQYLLRALVPFDPAFFRGHPPASWPPSAATASWLLVAAAVVIATVLAFRRRRLAAFAAAWMAAALVPSSTLVPLAEMVVDHRAYLGSVAVAFAMAAVLWTPERRYFACALLALMAGRAVLYERVLADPVKAWEDAVRRAPASPDAWRALADAYSRRGDPRAAQTLQHAVSLEPRDARGWANLGVEHAQAGRWAEAAEALQAAIRAEPGDPRLHDNLGAVLEAQGRTEDAMAAYEAAIRTGRPLAQPRIRLARLLVARGDRARAGALLDEAARLEIDEADARDIEALRQRLR